MLRQPDTGRHMFSSHRPLQRLVGQLELQSEVPFVLFLESRDASTRSFLRMSPRAVLTMILRVYRLELYLHFIYKYNVLVEINILILALFIGSWEFNNAAKSSYSCVTKEFITFFNVPFISEIGR